MAIGATVCKVILNVSDIDRNYYAEHRLTVSREPSEPDERFMARVLAFALNADDDLAFARGQAEADEPELWRRGLDGGIGLWIELGLPDPKRLRKASARADEVLLYLYHGRQASVWWEQRGDELSALPKLRVVEIGAASVRGLAAMADKSLELSCLVQDGQAWLDDGRTRLELELRVLKERSDR
ncbi:MAG: YaeQ family protein [Spirochaetaceae bacterium]|nr:YaeQ family protein [Spirochaetaceae bacterium]